MKKSILLILILVFFSTWSNAQSVGIGTGTFTPDASSMLEIQSTNKGLLIPRVALTQTTSASPVTDPLTSLLIYNTSLVNDVKPGYYYWDGSKWVRFNSLNSGSGTLNYVPKWTPDGTTLGNSQIFDNGTNVGIGTDDPQVKLHVEGTSSLMLAGFINNSTEAYAAGILGKCDTEPSKGIGIFGNGGLIGVMGTSETEFNASITDDFRIGVAGSVEIDGPNKKFGVQGKASGTGGINVGVYGIAEGADVNFAGFFLGDAGVSGKLMIGSLGSVPAAQLHTNGTVRFEHYTDGFLTVDNLGNLGVSTGSSLFNAGSGLSWVGSTLNSVWTSSGNNIYNNNSKNVGIGTTSPVAKMQIDINSGVIADNSSMDKYNSLFFQTGIPSGEGSGIAFTVFGSGAASDYSTYTPGGAIVFERTASNSMGKLHFKVKTTTVGTDALTKAMTISDNANVGIRTTSPGSTLHVNGSIAGKVYTTSTDAAYTIPADAFFFLSTATISSPDKTLTLPTLTSGVSDGRVLYIRQAGGSGTYGFNLIAASGNTISFAGGWANPMVTNEGVILIANGTTWYMIEF